MNFSFCVLAAGVLLGSSGARADLTVVQTVEGLDQSMQTITRYKEGKTRLDTSPGGVSIIVDAKSGETLSLRHAEKAYIRAPSSVVQAAVDSMKKPGEVTPAPAPKATGRQETINGFPATEYVLAPGSGAHITLWLTHDIPDYERAMKELAAAYGAGPLAAMMQTGGLDMARLPGFPVRIVNEIHPGMALTSTVVSVSLAPVAEDQFTPPADYKEIKVPVLTPPTATSLPSPAGH